MPISVWYEDPAILISISSTIIAGAALVYSAISARTARRSYQLALAQDERKKPALNHELLDCWVRRSEQHRTYSVSLMLLNSSESPTTVVRTDLSIVIRPPNGPVVNPTIVRVPIQVDEQDPTTASVSIAIPAKLEQYQAESGLLHFKVNEAILNGRIIESISLLVEDLHQQVLTIGPINPREV